MRFIFTIATLVLLTVHFSCSMIANLNSKEFTFYKNEKEQKLVFWLPDGKAEENFKVGENDAKEQFYYFDDGPVFYITRNIPWQTVNQHRIDALDTNFIRKQSAYSGRDKNGLFWKEVVFEDFKIGYAYVAAHDVDRYNEALNSIKIKLNSIKIK